jgi:hypothetical protein
MPAIADLTEMLQSYPPLLTAEQLEELGVAKIQTLNNWRCTRRGGPPFVKLGRLIRYPKSGLIKYLNQNTVDTLPPDEVEQD